MDATQESKSTKFMTRVNLLAGISLLLMPLILKSITNYFTPKMINNFHVLDYEGFHFSALGSYLLGVLFLSLGLYLLLKKDASLLKDVREKGLTRNFYIGIHVLFFSILLFPDYLPNFKHVKYHLPLQKISTTQIEATLSHKETIFLYNRPKYGRYASVSVSLEEYPDIYFSYKDGYRLKDEIINLTDDDPTKNKFKDVEKLHRIAAGEKIKIRFRTKDYEELAAFLKSDDYKQDNSDDNIKAKRFVHFYEIAHNDEILLQKHGLK